MTAVWNEITPKAPHGDRICKQLCSLPALRLLTTQSFSSLQLHLIFLSSGSHLISFIYKIIVNGVSGAKCSVVRYCISPWSTFGMRHESASRTEFSTVHVLDSRRLLMLNFWVNKNRFYKNSAHFALKICFLSPSIGSPRLPMDGERKQQRKVKIRERKQREQE